jgi:hypothetical protein
MHRNASSKDNTVLSYFWPNEKAAMTTFADAECDSVMNCDFICNFGLLNNKLTPHVARLFLTAIHKSVSRADRSMRRPTRQRLHDTDWCFMYSVLRSVRNIFEI